MDQEILSFLL